MLRLRPWTRILGVRTPSIPVRTFTETVSLPEKALPPRLKINDADLTISYLKGTGPGGQKINKTNSAVQIIHKPSGVVVKCQATRSRSQNEKTARLLLADKVEHQEKGENSRVSIKAEAAKKKKASKMKKANRKYRALNKDKEKSEGEVPVDGEEELDNGSESPEKSTSSI